MNNDLALFESADFGTIRTVVCEDGKVLLCGADVAKALGYTNPRKAVRDHCKGGTKRSSLTPGGIQDICYVPESDVYRLIVHSKLPSAERFERWVFDEVIPSIRKNGGYIQGQENMSDAELMAKALLAAQRVIESRDKQIADMQPKALFADSVAASSSTILIGELAKILKQNGADMGEKRLFAWLRDNGYLIKRAGTDYNMPTQRSMEQGLFRIKETAVTHSDGHTSVNKTTKVTGKGQQYFINLFVEKKGE